MMETKAETFQRDWSEYYDAIAGRPPRETLLKGLQGFETPGFAVNLGCGDGRDTVELLRQGWTVLAIDGQPDAIARLDRRPDLNSTHLETRVERFETLQFPSNIDLINASFSLPFCPPEAFPELWRKIVAALRTGGYFCGQLFGERDSWASNPLLNHHTRSHVEELLKPFEIERLEEEEHPGQTPLGEDRDWHIFHIVVRKTVISEQ